MNTTDTISIRVDTAESILDKLCALLDQCSWWKNDPRAGYKEKYASLCEDVEYLEGVLGGNETLNDD